MPVVYKEGNYYGGGGGSDYTAGDGIVIENDEISTDNMSAADMSEIVTPVPSVMSRLPILFDESGACYQIGWYRYADGTKKPIYEQVYQIIETPLIPTLTSNTSASDICTATSGGYYSSAYPWKAYDNDVDTHWASSANNSGWVGIEFVEPQKVNKILVIPHYSSYGRVKSFRLIGSNDNYTTNDLLYAGDCVNMATEQIFEFDNENEYLYYKFQVDNMWGTGGSVCVRTLQLYTRNTYNPDIDILIEEDRVGNYIRRRYTKVADTPQ